MTTQQLLDYWRTSLIDGEKLGIKYSDLNKAVKVHFSQAENGSISLQDTARIFQMLEPKRKKPTSNRFEADNDKVIEVVIAPLEAKPLQVSSRDTNQKAYPFVPIWIPAQLDQTGKLLLPEDNIPWVPRSLLEPLIADFPIPVLGNVEDEEEFFKSQPFPQDGQWKSYWAYAEAMLRYVTGYGFKDFQKQGFQIKADAAYILPSDLVLNIINSIVTLYNQIERASKTPTLFNRLATLNSPAIKPLVEENTPQWHEISVRHVGQMSGRFSLSKSQRQALYHFLTTGFGDILAINGPPGTGKTTLLQSAIATLWVDAAVRQVEPPMILASSANNQAVQNIIFSFGAIGVNEKRKNEREPEGRWLPQVQSYGLYCVKSRGDKDKPDAELYPNLQIHRTGNSPFFDEKMESAYIAAAVPFFLTKCSERFDRNFTSVVEARQYIHETLTHTVKSIYTFFDTRLKLFAIQQRYQTRGGIDAAIADQTATAQLAGNTLVTFKDHRKAWDQHVAGREFLLTLFSFFGPVKKQIKQKNKVLLISLGIPDSVLPRFDDESIERFFQHNIAAQEKQVEEASQALNAMQQDQQLLQRLTEDWQRLCKQYGISENVGDLNDALDTAIRAEAFRLATHYWEASYIIEVQSGLPDPEDESKEAIEKMWRLRAKLTPCLVSTLHMLPKFFWADKKQMLEFIDLLIIDEAGQVTPELGAASFGLAKKALIVGDIFQIEPVTQMLEPVDDANLHRCGLVALDDIAGRLKMRKQISGLRSSIMRLAQNSSYYQATSERGMFLREHRRCADEIIQYCNRLTYAGTLLPCREKEDINKPTGLPFMGYAHIPGQAERGPGGRSWTNPTEVSIICRWLRDKRQMLEEHYKKPIKDIVGVVTPFAPQKDLFARELAKLGMGEITAGTVHALQGAEREIVIFSPVYHEPVGRNFFFDEGVNMLNVAVSRAKDSFLVFGNMSIFNPMGTKPSSLLAQDLLSSDENELTEVYQYPMRRVSAGSQTQHIIDLAAHRDLLKEFLETAQKTVLISSPQLSSHAIEDDDLEHQIHKARQRGVEVIVYTDQTLNVESDKSRQWKFRAEEARNMLVRAGADLRVVERAHNKTLCKDSDVLVEGSFNWLSAVRKVGHDHQRQESSMCYSGIDVPKMIDDVVRVMESKRLPASK